MAAIATVSIFVAGCNKMPDRYTATLKIALAGDVSSAPSELPIAFKKGVVRVDLRDSSAMPGFGLAWQNRPQVLVVLPGREAGYRMPTKGVSDQYGTLPLDEVLVLPFSSSKWMEGARKMADGQKIDGQPCTLWAKLTKDRVYRVWVHDKWSIPIRMETLDTTGQAIARYDLTNVKPNADIPDSKMAPPEGIMAPALPPNVP